MFATEPAGPQEAPGIIEATLRYRSLTVAMTLIGCILGAALALIAPKTSTAVGRLVLTDPRGNTIFHDGQSFQIDLSRSLAERADFASSTAVYDEARKMWRAAGTNEDLRDKCDITGEDTGSVMVITCTYGNSKDALGVVNALAEAYRQQTKSQTAVKADAALGALEDEKTALRETIERERTKEGSDAYVGALAQSAANRLTELEKRSSDIRTQQALFGDGTESFDSRVEPSSGRLVQLIRNSLIGGVLGFFAAVLVSWFRADRSPIANTSRDVSAILGLPLLGEVEHHLIADAGIDLVATPEAPFQLITSHLGSVLSGGSVLFAPVDYIEGHEDVVIKAALVAARAGKQVLLIDGDDTNRSVAKLLGLPPGPGLTDYLTGQKAADSVTVRIAFDKTPGLNESSLFLMGPGTGAAILPSLFRSSRTTDSLAKLKEQYDLILIDGPSLLNSAGSAALGQAVDGVVVMVERGTPQEAIASTRGQLAFLPSDVLGFVFIHDA